MEVEGKVRQKLIRNKIHLQNIYTAKKNKGTL